MKIGPIPLIFFIVGAVLKGMMVIFWRLYQPAEIYGPLIKYDPIGIWMAENITSIFLTRGGLLPDQVKSYFMK